MVSKRLVQVAKSISILAETEVYDFDTDQWTDAPDYPFES